MNRECSTHALRQTAHRAQHARQRQRPWRSAERLESFRQRIRQERSPAWAPMRLLRNPWESQWISVTLLNPWETGLISFLKKIASKFLNFAVLFPLRDHCYTFQPMGTHHSRNSQPLGATSGAGNTASQDAKENKNSAAAPATEQ